MTKPEIISREDFLYVAASAKRTVFLGRVTGRDRLSRVRHRLQAAIFWTWGEAYSRCLGRKGWSPLRVGLKLPLKQKLNR